VNATPVVDGETVVALAASDLQRLTRLCVACTAFFELIEGNPASVATAAELLDPLPPEYARCVRYVFAVERGGTLVALAELLQGHPSEREWYIGLLLIAPELRRRGLGGRFYAALVDWIRERAGTAVRVVVQQQNPDARAFWERQGFRVEREAVKQAGRLENRVWILART
jgi:ribosomal protein S18 acetylase RimI-like enzyme